MSYACSGTLRIKRFSNPNVYYNGLPTGKLNSANNARILETDTRFKTAAFRNTPVSTNTFVHSKQYKISAKHSLKVLDVSEISYANGAKIHQWDYVNGANKKWVALDKGNGYWQLKAVHSGKCLDVGGASTADGASIIQWDCHNNNQQFKAESVGNDYFYLRAKHSNKCVDVGQVSGANGGVVHQWSCVVQDNAKWKLEKLN